MFSLFGELCNVWLGTFFADALSMWCAVTSTGWQSFCVCMLPFICRGLSTVLSFQSLNSLPWCSATHSNRFTLHCLTFSCVVYVTLSLSWSSCWHCLERVGFQLKLLWIFTCWCVYLWYLTLLQQQHQQQLFYGPFLGPPRWASTRRELLHFMVQGEINRGTHTDHPAGRHSIRTNQCPLPPCPHIFLPARCPSCRPANSVKAL